MILTIATDSRGFKEGKERGDLKGEYGGIWGEKEENADYGGMVQHSQNRNMLHHMEKGLRGDRAREVWECWQHFGPASRPRTVSLHIASYDMQGYGGRILLPAHRGKVLHIMQNPK